MMRRRARGLDACFDAFFWPRFGAMLDDGSLHWLLGAPLLHHYTPDEHQRLPHYAQR